MAKSERKIDAVYDPQPGKKPILVTIGTTSSVQSFQVRLTQGEAARLSTEAGDAYWQSLEVRSG